MAQIAVGEAITAGFGLIRRRPMAVLAWGLVQIGLAVAIFGLMAPFYIAIFGQLASGDEPDPMALQAASMQMQGFSMLLNLVSAGVSALLYCAVFRAILHPEQSRWGYLRLGAAEGYTLVLMIAAYFIFAIGLLVLAIPIGIVIGILAATRAVAAAVIVGVIAAVVVLVGAVYLALRFSMAAPMIVDDGKFHLMESWTLTKGHAGQLFLVTLGSVGLLLLLEILILLILFGVGTLGLSVAAGGLGNIEAFFKQSPGAILAGLAPFLAVLAILWIPIAGAVIAIWGAPWGKAYRDLVQPDVSTTFA